MFRSYLPAKYNTWFILIISFALIFHFLKIFTLVFIVYIFFYLLFRKKANYFRDDPVIKAGIVFSPCNGKIVSIKNTDNDRVKIKIAIYPWKEMGIFMPISSEIINLWRSKEEVILELANNLDLIEIHFFKRSFGFWPELIVSAGDRGARQVNIGFFPFGGLLELDLPKKYEILIKNFTEVIAGETIIAVLHEKN